MRISIFLVCDLVLALSGCASVETHQTHEAAMWGPCRDMALQREADERAAGYDAGTQQAALTWTYKDCVAADLRMNVHSVYEVPASRAGSAAGY